MQSVVKYSTRDAVVQQRKLLLKWVHGQGTEFLKNVMWPLVLRTSDFIRETRLALRRPELECPIDPGATITMCQVRSGHVSSGLAGLGEVKWGQVRSVRVRSSQTGSLT